jgi:signal transduction histidine kinase
MIREEVTRSDRIITELMGYAQLAEGRVERVQVHDEIEQAIGRAFPPALQHEILIQVNCPKDLPPLLLQRAHLREALVNLLTNARDALVGKGRIEVAAHRDNRDAVVISVTDNGPGIPDYQREQIFEPYFSTKEKGTGLGLAIVRHNVEIYGGKVGVESTLGKGSCFTLTFPAKSTMTTAA